MRALRTGAILLMLAMPGPAVTDQKSDYLDGLTAYQRKDYVTALRFWRPLAEQGYAAAQNELGLMYFNGRGVPKDYVLAMQWYRLAADQGYAAAQYNLGLMYTNGRGVPKDYVLAAKWYRLAAEQGSADAQSNLGAMYGTGRGVPQDQVLAYMWRNLAAAGASVANVREQAEKGRDALATRMTPTQIAEAQRLSREWKAK